MSLYRVGADASPELMRRIVPLRLMVFDFDGVFTDNLVYVFEDGREAVRCSRSDGFGLRRLERLGVEPIIISTETNPVVTERSKKLKVFSLRGCEEKASALEAVLRKRGLAMAEVGFVGNDINDLGCLSKVGLPIAVRDAHPDILSSAAYRTRLCGGHGAVREVCDLIGSVLERSR